MNQQQLHRSRINNKKTKKHIHFVKILLIILWGLFLLANTWTESLEQLLDFQSISFKWVSKPDIFSFFYFYDLTLVHPDYIKVKLGHFIGFAIMDLLLLNWLKKHKYSIVISITFALLTEFLQLFFGRDGRFYDLLIDSLGVLTVFFILRKARV